MTTDEKLARNKEERQKLTKIKKAERERARRAKAKENEKEILKMYELHGYNPMKQTVHEITMKYIEKYGKKYEDFLKKELEKIEDAKKAEKESEESDVKY